jgi:hypothetical protein
VVSDSRRRLARLGLARRNTLEFRIPASKVIGGLRRRGGHDTSVGKGLTWQCNWQRCSRAIIGHMWERRLHQGVDKLE